MNIWVYSYISKLFILIFVLHIFVLLLLFLMFHPLLSPFLLLFLLFFLHLLFLLLLFFPAVQDYVPLPTTTITFNSVNTLQSVPVTIVNDNRAEGSENFTATLSSVGPANRINIVPAVASVEISDDDSKENISSFFY